MSDHWRGAVLRGCESRASAATAARSRNPHRTRPLLGERIRRRAAPDVCFFHGDIAIALRWFGNVHDSENDNLLVAFYGHGIGSEPMGDFDDIGFIRDAGMSHSIPYLAL